MDENTTSKNSKPTENNQKPSIFDSFSNNTLCEEEILRQKHCTLHHTAQLIKNLSNRQY